MKKRLIALLMALVSLTLVFAGCGDSSDGGDNGDRIVSERTLTGGVHDYTAPERENDYFVKNGVCEYRIIAPNSAEMGVKTKEAVNEFNFFLNEATGITIPFTNESATNVFTHDDDNKYISIGNTKLLESAGLSGDYDELGISGVRIKTLGNTIYLYGAYDDGHLYAVYDFMQIMFNYEIYATDLWEIDKVDTVKMRDFDVVDIPDTQGREPGWDEMKDEQQNGYMRFRYGGSEIMPVGDTVYNKETATGRRIHHNVMDVVARDNPAVEDIWYSDVGTQLCYTAHGDEDSRERMVKHVAKIVETSLIDYKDYPDEEYWCFTLTSEDVSGECLCEACRDNIDDYGSAAGSVILFMNDLMTEIESWWDLPENAEYKRENFYGIFFAYAELAEAPATRNPETGKYELNNGLTIHEHVGVYLCNDKINHNYGIYHEKNDVAREHFVAWMDVASEFFIWCYDNNFSFDVSFWDTYGHYDNEGFNFYLSRKPRVTFMEVGSGYVRTSFSQLKMYIHSKMMWNCSLDHNELIEKWFNATFGVSASIMKQLFDSEALFEKSIYSKVGSLDTADFLVVISGKQNWTLPAVKEWISIIERAHAVNEQYNKAYFPEKYNMIKKNIDREYIYPAYVILSIYSEEECGATYTSVIKYLKDNDAYFSGVKNELSELSNKWRNFSLEE